VDELLVDEAEMNLDGLQSVRVGGLLGPMIKSVFITRLRLKSRRLC
jgi:hypothetical protein